MRVSAGPAPGSLVTGRADPACSPPARRWRTVQLWGLWRGTGTRVATQRPDSRSQIIGGRMKPSMVVPADICIAPNVGEPVDDRSSRAWIVGKRQTPAK